MVPARCDSRDLQGCHPRNPATDGARTLISMWKPSATAPAVAIVILCVTVLLAACSTAAPSATTVPASPAATASPSLMPSPTPRLRVRAPAGVATDAVIRGAIYLGFEACVGLTPGPDSPYLPPLGQDDFVLVFPKGWKVVPAHPTNPLFGDDFQVHDATGKLVAVDGDEVEIEGAISMLQASYCGFGWPIAVRRVSLAGG